MHTIQSKDMALIWHPCSQMKDYASFKPLIIKKASGCYFELQNGKRIIDAISSWWCKSLGHQHPILKKAIKEQMEKFEHVIFANTTNEILVELSTELINLMPHLKKVFYAGDGSCAIEVALKMSLQCRLNEGSKHKNQFVALRNSYHGETLGALSVSDVSAYKEPFLSKIFSTYFIQPLYVTGISDKSWDNAEAAWLQVEKQLNAYHQRLTAIIVEPLVQGAGGMKIYSKDFLYRLAIWAKKHHIHLIADEIMTGLGRTGKMLACEHANVFPDFVCLSKGLTAGWMPFSAVLTTNEIYQLFYDDYETGKAFLHSHTYSGNALAASVAFATLKILKSEKLCDKSAMMQNVMLTHFQSIADETGYLTNIRGIGAIIAADLLPHPKIARVGYQVFQEAITLGAFLRPLGNTIYWLPPLTIDEAILSDLKDITLQAIKKVFE